jgi:hypothetical protein
MTKVRSKVPRADKPKPSSIYRGVIFDRKAGKWRAQIRDVRTKVLGNFDSELAAARAYNDAAQKLGRPINLLPL